MSKKRGFPALLLALVLVLAPITAVTAFAVDSTTTPATDTADFTSNNGTTAIALLNQYKETGAADSIWDNSSKTLTLNGINFTTTAQTAVKLPDGATIVLADDSHNFFQSGDVSINESGGYNKDIFVNALDAAGSLTIQGETAGNGSLSVYAGNVNNSGNAWTYSSGIAVNGDFTVKGGHVTAKGGYVEGKDSVFSIGVNMDNDIKNKALLVTGGSLSAIGGESYEIQDDGSKKAVFSRGVYMYQGNVTVSGNGGLCATSVDEMADATLLSNGLYILSGNLIVANSAEVAVAGGEGLEIKGGSIDLNGGKLTARCTQAPDINGNLGDAVSVWVDSNTANTGNITVSGGTLETNSGNIYVATYGATKSQGVFTVTGGSIIDRGQLNGAKSINISGGSVQTWGIDADALTLSGGTLTVREPVRQNSYNHELWASPAVEVSDLTVSGGTLDAAWNWGGFTPAVFPASEEAIYATALVNMPRDFHTATFTGGTTILDTGIAGNTALLIKGTLNIGSGMEETGADANHCQLSSDTPVKFAAAASNTPTTGGGYYYSGPYITAVLNGPAAKSATDYSGGIYGLIFRSSASFSSFQGVQVDGKTLDKSCYTVDEGGIEVYLKAVYLQTLAAGKHTLTILSTEGNATTEFTISGSNASPKTADAGILLYAGMALASLTGLAVTGRKRRA